MGVPPGSGQRMGLDRDLDGVLDGDVPPPTLRVALAGGNQVVLRWPYRATGYRLETSASLSPLAVWTNLTDALEISGNENVLTNLPAGGARFYRLKQP